MSRPMFVIDAEIQRILTETGEEGELTEEAAKQLDALQMEFDQKIESILNFRRFIQGWEEIAAAEEKRLKLLKQQYARKVEQVEAYVKSLMEKLDLRRLDLPSSGKVYIQKSPPKAVPMVEIDKLQPTVTPLPGIETSEETRKEVLDKYLQTGVLDDGWRLWHFVREKVVLEVDKQKALQYFKERGVAPPDWAIDNESTHLVIK